MRILISGGPGSGCTSTAELLGEELGLPVFDSDSYFHKKTDPPFQEQYTPEERRKRLSSALKAESGWILSGSVATWALGSLEPTHGIFLAVPKQARLIRLALRQRNQFSRRIDPGGDMQEEHESFMEWAAGYEERAGSGRNLQTDSSFLQIHCRHLLIISGDQSMEEILRSIIGFLNSSGGERTSR